MVKKINLEILYTGYIPISRISRNIVEQLLNAIDFGGFQIPGDSPRR